MKKVYYTFRKLCTKRNDKKLSMKDLIILGAGGASYNLIEFAEDVNSVMPTWNIFGLLDDNVKLIGKIVHGYKVLGSIDDSINYPDAYFISSIGSATDLSMRKRVRERVPFDDSHFATLIHPLAHISRSAKIGTGTVVCPYASIQAEAQVGHDCYINSFNHIAHEVVIGAHTVFAARSVVASATTFGECCYIGCGSAFKHDISIGKNCMIGMGSVIWRDIPDDSKMYAPHARTLKESVAERSLLKQALVSSGNY